VIGCPTSFNLLGSKNWKVRLFSSWWFQVSTQTTEKYAQVKLGIISPFGSGVIQLNPGIPTTIETMGVNITTIASLRVLIIEIGSTIILMVVEAQGKQTKNHPL